MRWVRLGIVGAAVLLVLHVVVLAGVDLGHPHVLVTASTLTPGSRRLITCPSWCGFGR